MNGSVKIYTDITPLGEGQLKNLSPIFSFHWKGLDKSQIFSGEFNEDSPFCLSEDPNEADFFALLMHWTYYLWNNRAKMHEAMYLAEIANKYGKPVIVWFKGDLVPNIPFENYLLFLPGIVRKTMKHEYRACPVFIDDPKPNYSTEKNRLRQKMVRPRVGFCGYGTMGPVKLGWSVASGLYLNAFQQLNQPDYSEIPIIPATLLRNRALKYLRGNSQIEPLFVVNQRYTPNQSSLQTSSTSRIFFSNIYETDYTLCVRGFGNWSYRFYETLACGRIPVFVDTDCVLPLETKIDWRRYCVWVDRSELHLIGEKILDFHSSLSPADFAELQLDCRKLWEEQLSLNGCMMNIQGYLKA